MSGRGLSVRDLAVAIGTGPMRRVPVAGVSLEVSANQCVALLGESGCGKSLTALALMRLLPDGVALTGGEARLDDEDLFSLPERDMRAVRGGRLAMIFQEPMTSLNPVMSLGAQIEEALVCHRDLDASARAVEVARLLDAVGLPARHRDAYPFQLSGGQRQRALIAMMLAGEPSVLIADEPTTALDVSVQAQILALLKDLQRQRGMGLLLITHDLDVARDMADHIAVMYAGEIVESAPREALFADPRHPYTQGLFRVLPSQARPEQPLAQIPGRVPVPVAEFLGCRFADRCDRVLPECRTTRQVLAETVPGHWVRCQRAEVVADDRVRIEVPEAPRAIEPAPVPVLELRDLQVHFPVRRGLWQRVVDQVRAVDGVSLSIAQGETLALVGESGCGKTTLARAALRLITATAGEIRLLGEAIGSLGEAEMRKRRAALQVVFQDPFSSLDPRMRVAEIVTEGLIALRPELSPRQRAVRVAEVLDRVGLPADAGERYPHEFSGGQRQRIAIARALAVRPRLLICDEPTSALDVSVQAQILNLLRELRRDEGLAYLFISHNLPVVAYLADRVAVMRAGRIVEQGETTRVMAAPTDDYTRRLIESAPGRGRI